MYARIALAWAVLVLGASVRADDAKAKAPAKRPNVVFILADDLGINDLGCYGRKEHPTPNLDRLAQSGIRFTNGYSAQSVCSPTRAAIMSGRHPARLHLTTFLPGRADAPSQLLAHPAINQALPAGLPTLPRLLGRAGYRSICIGKWHLGGKGSMPTDHGFDEAYAGTALTKPSATEGGKGEYDLTARAEKFLDENKDRPFFLYLAHNNPHVALVAKDELVAKHKNAFNPIYAAMIETLDDAVGRLLRKLDSLGLTENTIVVFTSDNGGLHVLEANQTATHNTPFRAGKGFLYEGGVRIPLLFSWPGRVSGGRTDDTPFVSTDWLATLLALVGETPPETDGADLSGRILHAKAPPPARLLYWHQPHYMNQGGSPSGAVRDGVWKLIEHYEDGRCELYRLDTDVGEKNDLSAQEPARVADLRGKLEKFRRDVKAQENVGNAKFNAALWRPLYQPFDASKQVAEVDAAAASKTMADWRAGMNAVLGAKKAPAKAAPGAGGLLLHARDAQVVGKKLRYELPPHKDTLGYWVDKSDSASWKFSPPHAGTFEVQILQACGKGSGGAEIELDFGGGKTLTTKVEETGHFQRFVPRTIGEVTLAAGETTLVVRAKTKPGGAVMDLRRVTLRDASK